ncbi:MAG TPA: Crp/Fnr family transcriptional regulator [Burkholderiales bacterium]|nr:Crp/Fnr family transcriptional regulator [Burkholderiales bacterium]
MSASRHRASTSAAPPAAAAREPYSGDAGAITPSNFLAQLEPVDHKALVALAALQRYAKGSFVFRAGSPGNNVYFLVDGKVKIKQLSPAGREVILWFCLPGEIFGLAEVARGGGRVVSAQACEASDVLAVPQERFRSYLAAHPRVAQLSMQVLAHRLRVLGEMFVNLVADDVNTRLAKLILRLCSRYGTRVEGELRLNLPLTHQEIADMIGTTRQTVTTALSALKRKGVLTMEAHRVRIDSEERLHELGGAA